MLRAPGRNADAVAEITVALLFAVNRGLVRADRDVREPARSYRDGTIPYQRFRAWELAGRTAGLVGLGAVGRAVKWRLEGLGMRVIAYDPYAPDATHSLDDLLARGRRRVAARRGHARDRRPDRRRPVRPDEGRRDLRQLGARAAARHRRARRRTAVGATSPGPGSTTSSARTCPSTIRSARWSNVVLTPHIGGATYDTEANHSKLIADGIATLLAGGRPDNLVNPEVLDG